MVGEPIPAHQRVAAVRYLRDYVIETTFQDGSRNVVNMKDSVWGEIFEPLNDLTLFSQVRFDPEQETAVWPNGADVSPEFLRWGPHLPHGCACGYEDPDEHGSPQRS